MTETTYSRRDYEIARDAYVATRMADVAPAQHVMDANFRERPFGSPTGASLRRSLDAALLETAGVMNGAMTLEQMPNKVRPFLPAVGTGKPYPVEAISW